MTDLTPDLQFLIGEPLNSLNFVMDYVELHFNGSFVSCLAPPTVHGSEGSWTFPAAGSRDAFCGLIGSEVRAIRAVDGDEFRIEFSDGAVVRASLSHATPGENLHFHNRRTKETQWW